MKISAKTFCRIHNSRTCCGREKKKPARIEFRPRYAEPKSKKWIQVRPGVYHQTDPHHPRGYRVRLSRSRMEMLLNEKVAEQGGLCCICHEKFIDLRDVTPEHIAPSSMGGAWRDDHESNIGAAHSQCNFDKGSKRVA